MGHLHIAKNVRDEVLGQLIDLLLQNLVWNHARTKPKAANCVELRVIDTKAFHRPPVRMRSRTCILSSLSFFLACCTFDTTVI